MRQWGMPSTLATGPDRLFTSRISLRPLSSVAPLLAGDPSTLSRFHQLSLGEESQAEPAADYVAGAARSDSDVVAFAVMDIASREVRGLAGLRSIERQQKRARLGPIWTTGSGEDDLCDVMHLLLRFGFDVLDLSRVEVRSDARHDDTRRLLVRLGFRVEGTLRSYRIDAVGVPYDIVVSSVTRKEWPRVGYIQQAVIAQQDWPWKDRLPSMMPP